MTLLKASKTKGSSVAWDFLRKKEHLALSFKNWTMIAFSTNHPETKPNQKNQTHPKLTNPLQIKWLIEKKSPFCCNKRYLEHPWWCEFSQFISLLDRVDHGMVCVTPGLLGPGGMYLPQWEKIAFFGAYTSCVCHSTTVSSRPHLPHLTQTVSGLHVGPWYGTVHWAFITSYSCLLTFWSHLLPFPHIWNWISYLWK